MLLLLQVKSWASIDPTAWRPAGHRVCQFAGPILGAAFGAAALNVGALLFTPACWFSPLPRRDGTETGSDVESTLSYSRAASTEYTLWECLNRYVRSVSLFYFTLCMAPQKFGRSHYMHMRGANLSFRGRTTGMVKALLLPFRPVGLFWLALYQTIRHKPVVLGGTLDVRHDLSADGFFHRLVHTNYRMVAETMSMFYSGLGHLSDVGLWTSFSKDFWRNVLTKCGATVPPEVARWKKGNLEWKIELPATDLVVKAERGAMSVGDAFFRHGEDFATKDDVHRLLREKLGTAGHSLVLERVLPDNNLGVHSFDITTALGPSGDVHVFWASICHKCTDFSSNHCTRSCRIDPTTGKVLGNDQWYRNRHNSEASAELIGTIITGGDKICAKAVSMHKAFLKSFKQPTRFFISWDAMITEDGGIVWFEANPSNLRMCRPMFSSWAFLFSFVQNYAWPMRQYLRMSP